MKKTHIIIYIPGLGDHNLTSQQRALAIWRIYGVRTEICPMNWLEDEPWKAKLERLLKRIERYYNSGYTVSLVGVSAGSTAALQAFSKQPDQISTIALICPKFQHPETVHPMRYKMNPALKVAITSTAKAVNDLSPDSKSHIRIYRPIYDDLLPRQETEIPGVVIKTIPSITHVGGIAYTITLGSFGIVRFLKKT